MNSYMLLGRNIYTMDDNRPKAEAVGVVGDRIVAVGTKEEVAAALPPGARRYDAGDQMVVPGFTDSHNHLAYLARKWRAVDLEGCGTPEEALSRVRDYTKTHPDVSWVDGHGWDPNRWEVLPDRFDLDRIVPDRPVALASKDGHALWANSLALEEAGLLGAGIDDLPFHPGLILRDAKTGEPTGIVYESAVKFVLQPLPVPGPEEGAEAVAAAVASLHAQGITAVHCPETIGDWRAYRLLRNAGRLGVRVTYWLPVALLEEAIALGMATGVGDEWLRLGPVKLFADGTLGQRTAAMLEPYEGEPDNRGVALYSDEELTRLARRAAEHGFAVAIHAIGDGAVRQCLDALEAARAVPGTTSLRHRIEHAQLVHEDDIARFAALDVVASVQPLHCPADRMNADNYWGRRTAGAFAFRSLVDAGVTLAFGSDAPFGLDLTVNSFSVLAGIDAAVNRKTPRAWLRAGGEGAGAPEGEGAGAPGGEGVPAPEGGAVSESEAEQPWHPEQRLTVEEALRAFTIDAARAGGEDRWRGSISPGKVADMVVLSEDLLAVEPERVGEVQVTATVVAGRVVFGEL